MALGLPGTRFRHSRLAHHPAGPDGGHTSSRQMRTIAAAHDPPVPAFARYSRSSTAGRRPGRSARGCRPRSDVFAKVLPTDTT
jgi:hypothetical protein